MRSVRRQLSLVQDSCELQVGRAPTAVDAGSRDATGGTHQSDYSQTQLLEKNRAEVWNWN